MADAAATSWRLLDTGPAKAAHNMAMDSVLLDLSSRRVTRPTVRFMQFSNPAVLIGRHQTVSHEVREDFCRAMGIDVNRRLTGGGAIFFDASQMGWELIASKRDVPAGSRLEDLTREICRAIIAGLELLGVEAAFRPRNDIEVAGRKISGTGGAYEGEAFLFQGTLLVDFDVETMTRALRIPTEKLSRHEIDSVRERVTCLADLLDAVPPPEIVKKALATGISRFFGIELRREGLSDEEASLLNERLPFYASSEWINEVEEPNAGRGLLSSFHAGDGGLVRAACSVDLDRRTLRSVLFTGDFIITPARTVYDLESSLKDCRFDEAARKIGEYFKATGFDSLALEPGDFVKSLDACLEKAGYTELGIGLEEANRIFTVGQTLRKASREASVLLVPYCAKTPDCEYRHLDGCEMCGLCTVGDAYGMARQKGLLPVSVNSYSHLREILAACRVSGVSSFIGCCCRAFFIKRHAIFTGSGLNGIIVDIENTTCYELAREEEAYQGAFGNQTNLRLELLEKLLGLVPNREEPPRLELPRHASL